MLLKIALQMAHDDYTDRRERQRQGIALAKAAGRSGGRKGDRATHARIVALREAGKSIAKTAELADCDRRSEERRVGKECGRTCRSRWSPEHKKKKKERT